MCFPMSSYTVCTLHECSANNNYQNLLWHDSKKIYGEKILKQTFSRAAFEFNV